MTKIKNAILSIPKVGEFYRIMKFEYASHFKFNAPNLLDVDFSKPIIWFVDSPTYGNGGDQAIAYATELFIKDNFSEYGFIEFTDMQYPYYMRWMRNKVKKTDIIILQGGGNLGNLYPYFEHVRRRVISNFKDIRTIIMPQSVYFTDDFSGKRALKRTRSIYQKNGNLTVACRERRSYELLRSKMPALDVISCPDMVFYLNGKFPTCERQKDMVCLLMRGDDQEKTISNNTVDEAIKKYCKNKKIMRTDTNVKKLCRLNERRGGVEQKLLQISECSLVLTDRLHGLIFSYITHTPCIFFPSRTGKTEAVYETWLAGNAEVTPAFSSRDSLAVFSVETLEIGFSRLRDCINRKMVLR